MANDSNNNANDSAAKNAPHAGLPPGWTRYTIIIKTQHLEKLRAFAFWGRIPLKTVIERILEKFLASNPVDPIPTMEKSEINNLFAVNVQNKDE